MANTYEQKEILAGFDTLERALSLLGRRTGPCRKEVKLLS